MRKLCRLLPVLPVLSVIGAGAVAFGVATPASAAEVTRVASSFDGDNKFDLHFGVGYDFNFKQAAILREWSDPKNPKGTMVRDLLYRQMRHVVTPTLEIGLYKDIAVYTALPIVVSDQRTYAFDKEAEPCVFADQASPTNPATCVRHDNSTTIRDGIIPRNGFDATKPAQPFDNFGGMDTDTIFKGANRYGLDQLIVGLKFGILNQDRLSHMPKWVIGLEGRFAVGKPMTFSRNIMDSDPAGNHRVGRGIHELGVWTALSRRYRFLDPFFTAWWYQAIRANGPNTEFRSYGPTQDRVNPQSNVGVSFGTEIVPFERKAKGQKVALNLRGLAMLKYGGRGYSEAWELFADSPALVGTYQPGQAGLECSRQDIDRVISYAKSNPNDPDPLANSGAPVGCQRFNGITNIQDFATFGLNIALHAQLSKYAVLMLGTTLSTDTRHLITAASRGKSQLGGDPNLVDQPQEINPIRRDVIDQVGRRYAVGDVFGAMGYIRFLLTF
ncbi:MAG TPA: hypothetical protein VIK91_15965 [Nannocystis sp.]